MLTYKLKIKSCDNNDLVLKMQQDYSYAFRKLYSNFDKINDDSFTDDLCSKYHLDSWQFESLKTDVSTKISQVNTLRLKNQEQQNEVKSELEFLENKNTTKAKRTKFRLKQKRSRLLSFSNIVFGSKTVLRKLSFLSNDKEKNKAEIKKVKQEYQDNRLLQIFIGGETYHHGNRKFVFDFEHDKVVFKPIFKTNINIEFFCSEKQYGVLLQLQDLIDQNGILPVTIRLSTDYICISFDEEILNGFGFKEKELKAELKQVSKDCKELRKEMAKSFHEEQTQRKLVGKIKCRYLAVDLNPQHIGCSICDKIDRKLVIIKKWDYDLTKLSEKLGLSSDDPVQVAQNNKRKHEICNIYKDMFKKAAYFRVAHFVMEDLDFKDSVINEQSREFNRKVRNIWHRTLSVNMITKYCHCLGIDKIEIKPCYSSFIGNIQYEFFDPVNASLEICRRGMFKFEKGTFFPKVTEADLDSMRGLITKSGDVRDKTELLRKLESITSWVGFFNLFQTDGLKVKYRRSLSEWSERFRLFSRKSSIILYQF